MNRIAILLFLFAASFSIPATAEIEKRALLKCATGICLYWWPKLSVPQGWYKDEDASYKISANVLVPIGEEFSGAPAVIYANAIYKPRVPNEKTREAYIQYDLETFKKDSPGIQINHLNPQKTADGQVLEAYSFSPAGKDGSWEVVAYGEEGEFYLTFVVSAKSQEALSKALPAFNQLVSLYKEKP